MSCCEQGEGSIETIKMKEGQHKNIRPHHLSAWLSSQEPHKSIAVILIHFRFGIRETKKIILKFTSSCGRDDRVIKNPEQVEGKFE